MTLTSAIAEQIGTFNFEGAIFVSEDSFYCLETKDKSKTYLVFSDNEPTSSQIEEVKGFKPKDVTFLNALQIAKDRKLAGIVVFTQTSYKIYNCEE